MADKTGKAFWTDASKKTATWTGVAAIAAIAAEQIEAWLDSAQQFQVGTHHWFAVIAVAVIRAVMALWQGNVGDRSKASFAAPAGPTVDVPASQLRDTGDDPDDG